MIVLRFTQGAKIPDECKFTVLITTFEIIISDCELLSDIDWRVCIIDEAHRLKNKNCKLMEGLKIFDLVSTLTRSLSILLGVYQSDGTLGSLL